MGLEAVVTTSIVKQDADLVHPDDAQYIWLPIAVLVGIFILAALVYAMSRSRCQWSCSCLKRLKTPRIDYINVDEEDSDVPMAGGDEFGEQYAAASLLSGRLHIQNRPEHCHSPQGPAVLLPRQIHRLCSIQFIVYIVHRGGRVSALSLVTKTIDVPLP